MHPKPNQASIIGLAQSGGDAWQEFLAACLKLGSEGVVRIHRVSGPVVEPETGQRVRTVQATITHPDDLAAGVTFHIGVQGDMVFTGYEQPDFQDAYRVVFPDGRSYESHLWWVEEPAPTDGSGDPHSTVRTAWQAASPIKMAIWWATYARLIDGQPLIDTPYR